MENYEYYIFVDDLSGNDNLKDSCKIVVSNNQTGVTLTDSIYWIGNQAIIKGDITITQLPIPTALQLTVDLECPYKGRIDTCSFDVDFDPCCAMISVLDTAVCEVDRIINLPLITSQNFDPNNIARTTWFCTPAPYTNTSRWEACVTSFNFSPLEIQTNFGDFYYYAEVELDELERPCTILRSDTGSVTIAKPLTGCSIRSTNKPYCYNGTTITPKILTVNASLTDDSTIQWFDQNGIIPNATNTTYAPPPLSLPTNFMDCYMDFVYTVKIENACSSNTCSTSIRLYNEEAPKGELFIESNKASQLCSGEDLILKYRERCTDLQGWQWSQSDDGLNYKPIQGAGSINPTWNTNSLYKDTRYRIIKKNGNVCPIDTLDLLVEIQEELSLTQLSFMYDNPCDPSSVTLSIDFNPCQVSCNYDVEWYYNGQLVQLTNHVSSPAMFTFNSSTLHGNYYAIIKDKTCPSQIQQSNTITLDSLYELYILGPCFRCNNNNVSLRGLLFNPPDSVNCSYSWTTLEEGEILTGDSTNTITVGNGGVYILATNCNGCEKRDTFNLLQCGPEGATRSNIDALNYGKINLTIYPNPVVDQLSLLFESSLMENYQVEIYNSEGRLLLVESLQAGTTNHQINTTNLPANLYWIDLKNEYGSIWRERFIKQN